MESRPANAVSFTRSATLCATRAWSATPGLLNHRQTVRPRRRHVGLALQVVVQGVHLPLDAVGVLNPELVLVRVAAVDAHLLAHWYACRFYAPKLNHHSVRRVHLDAHVVNRPLSATTALRQREVYRRPFGQEFDVAGFHLHWVAAEEPLVELSALAEVRDLHVRSEEHTSELQSLAYLVCRLLLEKKKSYEESLERSY